MEEKGKQDDKYHGTYPIRVIGKSGEQGIHMPRNATGDFAVFEDESGNFLLKKVGVLGGG